MYVIIRFTNLWLELPMWQRCGKTREKNVRERTADSSLFSERRFLPIRAATEPAFRYYYTAIPRGFRQSSPKKKSLNRLGGDERFLKTRALCDAGDGGRDDDKTNRCLTGFRRAPVYAILSRSSWGLFSHYDYSGDLANLSVK